VKDQEHADGHDSPVQATDHYRRLQVDPDAPHELIAEAYWYVASRLRAEQSVRRSAERELAALNTAYQVLAVSEQRRAYDGAVPRVLELRRQRAERAEQQQRRPLSARLLRRPQIRPQVDYYELLLVDQEAEPPLIARAYSILRTLHSKKATGEASKEYLSDLAQARTVLLDRERRAAYDESRAQPASAPEVSPAPEAKPAKKAPEVAAETIVVKPKAVERPERPADPRRGRRNVAKQARVAPAMSKALVAAAKGGSRLAVAGGQLGYRGLSGTAKGGGKGVGAALRAGRRATERLRRPERAKKPAAPLPDDRLLRDISPAAKARRASLDGPRRGRLIVRGPGGREETVDLGEEPVTLGSDRECDVPLAAEPGQVAPAHAQIWFTGERFVIRSLDPTHPTVLCGQRVNWAGLDDGDEIEIGPHHLRFEAAHALDAPPEFLTTERNAATSAEEIPERHE
jgi:curved DNA-binding protein CbpA